MKKTKPKKQQNNKTGGQKLRAVCVKISNNDFYYMKLKEISLSKFLRDAILELKKNDFC